MDFAVAVHSGSSTGESGEGGIEEGYSEVAAAAVVFGESAGARFADVHSARVVRCSLAMAEWNSEKLIRAEAGRSGEEVQGFAVDYCVKGERG